MKRIMTGLGVISIAVLSACATTSTIAQPTVSSPTGTPIQTQRQTFTVTVANNMSEGQLIFMTGGAGGSKSQESNINNDI